MQQQTIAVLRGGNASERAVSLNSGAAVIAALKQDNYRVLDWTIDNLAEVFALVATAPRPLIVFNALHGRGGEDGQLQAILDALDIPYTGSGMLASAIAMDKVITKRLWREMGLPTADYAVVTKNNVMHCQDKITRYPVMVKPAREGSSIGMCKVDDASQLLAALQNALNFDDHVLVESWIDGDEYTVAILGNEALPAIRLKTPHDFYDYEAKYQANTTQYLCPCGLAEADERAIRQLALTAFNALDARIWGRIDLMIDRQGKPWLLELNTVPGMTDHSLVPMAAKASGLDFAQLVQRIVNLSLCAG
ncbi:MAG: D-alanine--D-alanine ligase [Thiotrichales bacterium]|jgi:D-alanine-D-alanine ligase|nr:D-alanine--D-alanine ligase [Thiotrichales bacterium]